MHAAIDDVNQQQAHAAIVLNLADKQLQHVISAGSAAEVWMMLRRIHEGQDVANRLWLREKYATFTYGGDSMEVHVGNLEALLIHLDSAGCAVAQEHFCAALLRSLPSSYDGLMEAYRMSADKFIFPDIVNRVFAEEARQHELGIKEERTAILAGLAKKKNKVKKKGVCWRCGSVGHYQRNCRKGFKQKTSPILRSVRWLVRAALMGLEPKQLALTRDPQPTAPTWQQTIPAQTLQLQIGFWIAEHPPICAVHAICLSTLNIVVRQCT
ncbi:FOG: Transposon-encoded proteins with TYA, reverse transcriptase, integrase domains in various combinations [Plasmopara halstedii]|uniref:FOG: Transposon-encoded proteins with TYA, reverse transcriptase, integrase domains in various combinations n=1 Tax=Plasmopara halstedii TaxID=4781 RepID=A0A0P1ACG6_PLAHL|nr:FOG: Transposon-encoded proteins with TYA, reverse transcriptase, integrase domains in various combinations [Plasmopara halstedii]CEG38607.1 FOG: Transposon-encoded proteins with TYA, reverse transcriptase, integrase domains in various combinations [Plasmopara halstedii]|eukprot:XP_024574976.1 FOG: Transposon-encoded proteins with TYA, reverse transcriptase, integrase domains in various combinations [Plasmopara halstedii]